MGTGIDRGCSSGVTWETTEVPVEQILPNPNQPRKDFNDEALQDLADSIKEYGVLQPILIRPTACETDRYEIVAGERRWRASKMAGLETLPARVLRADDITARILALTENIQREDLSAIDRGEALRLLREIRGGTVEQLARELHMGRRYFHMLQSLDDLPGQVKDTVRSAKIPAGHAVLLGRLRPWPRLQAEAAELLKSRPMTVKALNSAITAVADRASRGELDFSIEEIILESEKRKILNNLAAERQAEASVRRAATVLVKVLGASDYVPKVSERTLKLLRRLNSLMTSRLTGAGDEAGPPMASREPEAEQRAVGENFSA